MLTPELSIWKCIYCEDENDHTNWKCWSCGKKKPKKSTVKRIISKRKADETKKQQANKKAIIAKLDQNSPETAQELEFDLSKLKTD